jgi:hypothetical protein
LGHTWRAKRDRVAWLDALALPPMLFCDSSL